MITMNISNEVPKFSLYFSTKALKVYESLMFMSNKHYPSETRIIINNNKNIAFFPNTCILGGTKWIHMDC